MKARLCLSKEPCELKKPDQYGTHCGLSLDSKCQHQGAMKHIFETKEQAFDFVVDECKK
jgi:hypothetical protein